MYQYGQHQTNTGFQPGSNQNNIYNNPGNGKDRIYFEVNSTNFRGEAERKKFYDILENKIHAYTEITLKGYASEEGDETRNFNLSDARAKKIEELIRDRYPNIRINRSACGEAEGDLKENRAVDISFDTPGYVWKEGGSESVGSELRTGNYSTRVTGEIAGPPPEDQNVVIYLSGLRFWGLSDGDYQHQEYVDDNINIAQQIRENFANTEMNLVTTSFVSGYIDGFTKGNVKSYIRRNLGINGKLILVGYSWGGDTLLELADELPANSVDLMITIDPADGPRTKDETQYNTPVGPAAVRIINYYQPNYQALTGSGNRRLPGEPPRITNFLIETVESGEAANHSNIDEDVLDEVVRDVIDELEHN